MKICLFYEDTKYSDKAYIYPENGNDGMAGTQYEYALLGKFLSINYSNDEIYMVHSETNKMYPKVKSYIYKNVDDAFQYFKNEKIDVVVYTVGQTDEWYKMLEDYDYNIPFIAWDHNHISYSELLNLRKSNKVKRIVCCGKELYDMYIDDEIIKKMTYIFNMLDFNMYPQRDTEVENNVVFLGAITPQKGFHILAKEWKNIVQKVPNAQLYVAGTGALYNKDNALGKYGIAEQSYEDRFIPYLVDKKGRVLSSVHFLGVVDYEGKKRLFKNAKVGIVNPSGKTECCSISTLEFASAGVPVATSGSYGLLDTVKDMETGLLSRSNEKFCKNVIRLLSDDELNERLSRNGKQFVKEYFQPNVIIKEWHKMIEDVVNGIPAKISVPKDNLTNRMKWIRLVNYYIKKIWVFRNFPSMMDYNNFRRIIK